MNAREWKPGDVARFNERGAFEHIAGGCIVIDPAAPDADLRPLVAMGSVENVRDTLRSLARSPKPEEPLGLGAVVEDADGERFVRYRIAGGYQWTSSTTGAAAKWAEIAAVKVLSEGVTA